MDLTKTRSWVGLTLVLAATSAGCGPDGPERYRMSGKVTFEGKPVPTGMIAFEPAQKGIGGGFAPIMDGTYDTDRTGRGHLGGEHTIQITGFAGVRDPTDPDSPAVPMFPPYKFDKDLPTESTTVDFELPMDPAP